MSTLDERLRKSLEPILEQDDPAAAGLSTYSDMPCALFVYDPEEEFRLRVQVAMLDTRLSQKGKRVRRVSLAECLDEAMRSQRPLDQWFEAERSAGTETVVETVHAVLWEYSPLVDHVASRMPADPDPTRDIVLILRAGALFPMYRTSALLEQLKGQVHAPTVLFYPGRLDGSSLSFMGVLDPERNYRLNVF